MRFKLVIELDDDTIDLRYFCVFYLALTHLNFEMLLRALFNP